MKKLFFTILLLLTIIGISAQTEFLYNDSMSATELVLQSELDQARSLVDHYRKMAVYAEEETMLSRLSEERTLSYVDGLYSSLNITNDLLKSANDINANLVSINDEALAMISHHEQLQIGYEAQLYDSMILLQRAQIQTATLEEQLTTTNNNLIILAMGIVICSILYLAQSLILGRKTRTPKAKKEVPLKIVKEEPKEDTPKKVSFLKSFFTRQSLIRAHNKSQRAKMKQLKLNKRRAKELTPKSGDMPDNSDKMADTNKKLLTGPLAKLLVTIGLTKLPKEETPKEETPKTPKETVKTGEAKVEKSKPVQKAKVPRKQVQNKRPTKKAKK